MSEDNKDLLKTSKSEKKESMVSENFIFDESLVKNYPKSNKKVGVQVKKYSIKEDNFIEDEKDKTITTYISPFGIEFQGPHAFAEGTLLKIEVAIPDYWQRKQKLVDYSRIDSPSNMKILAKVVKTEDIGKRGKKKVFLCQTVNIDEIDEHVLKLYLQDSK